MIALNEATTEEIAMELCAREVPHAFVFDVPTNQPDDQGYVLSYSLGEYSVLNLLWMLGECQAKICKIEERTPTLDMDEDEEEEGDLI